MKGQGLAAEASRPTGYEGFLRELKARICSAQSRAALSVNRELILLYWEIGGMILSKQSQEGWGAKVVDRLALDLRQAFPGIEGFSPRNLKYMRAFAVAWPDGAIVQQLVAQLPWGHQVRLLDKVKDAAARRFYAEQAIEHGWSRNVLSHHIDTGLFERQGRAVSNFARTLPREDSDLAQQVLRDPYNFDFLMLGSDASEREIERGLLEHLRSFLLELGVGFAFVGSQYRLTVDDRDFYLDLLFYHLKLRAFVVIELKAGEFEPEHAGKMSFYLSAVDALLRHPDDRPTIGLILCRTRSRVIAEYALRDSARPIGVAAYTLTASLPESLAAALPSVADLEAELVRDVRCERGDKIDPSPQPADSVRDPEGDGGQEGQKA